MGCIQNRDVVNGLAKGMGMKVLPMWTPQAWTVKGETLPRCILPLQSTLVEDKSSRARDGATPHSKPGWGVGEALFLQEGGQGKLAGAYLGLPRIVKQYPPVPQLRIRHGIFHRWFLATNLQRHRWSKATTAFSIQIIGSYCSASPNHPRMRSQKSWPQCLFAKCIGFDVLAHYQGVSGTLGPALLSNFQANPASRRLFAPCKCPSTPQSRLPMLLRKRQSASAERPPRVVQAIPWHAVAM